MQKFIDEKIHYENKLTDYVRILQEVGNKDKIKELAEKRNMPIDILEKHGIFYVNNMAEMIIPKYINDIDDFGVISPTNKKPIYSDRWVIPIKNEYGEVRSLVGYSDTADESYVFGKAKYYLRKECLFGLENIEEAYEKGYAILVEGIMDAIRLRSIGYTNTFATCGAHELVDTINILNRPAYGVIRIPDRDKAGLTTKKLWSTKRYITLNVGLKYKDPDEMLRYDENTKIFTIYLNECIRRILIEPHRGHEYKEIGELTII